MPVKLDMSTAQPIQQAGGVKLDMSTAQPIGEESLPPIPKQSRLMQSLSPPRPFSLGPGQPEKDPDLATAGVAGIALGAAGPTIASKAAPYVAPAAASYLINKAREWPIVGPIIDRIPMAEMLPWLFEGKGKGKAVEEGTVARGSIAKEFKNPGAHLPADPLPEQLNPSLVSPARTLPGQHSPEVITPRPAPRAAGPTQRGPLLLRGSIAESMEKPAAEPSPIVTRPAAQQSAAPPPAPAPTPTASPRPVARGTLNKMMDRELGNALGAKPLDPKIPLRKQMPGRMPEVADTAQVPEGHTPVESSALRSYRYDPAEQEFHAQYNSGNKVHIFGDVSAEEAQAFEAAPSKGRAMALISKHPEVARIIDGKRVTVPRRGVTSAP